MYTISNRKIHFQKPAGKRKNGKFATKKEEYCRCRCNIDVKTSLYTNKQKKKKKKLKSNRRKVKKKFSRLTLCIQVAQCTVKRVKMKGRKKRKKWLQKYGDFFFLPSRYKCHVETFTVLLLLFAKESVWQQEEFMCTGIGKETTFSIVRGFFFPLNEDSAFFLKGQNFQ